MFRKFSVVAAAAIVCAAVPGALRASPAEVNHAGVVANDNRRPSGRTENGTLKIALRAGRGTWQPEGRDGVRLVVEAFGEGPSPLMVPAPLIRAEEGTPIEVSVRNDLDEMLLVHGLCARDSGPCLPLSVAPGETRISRFRIDQPGTYHYWATAIGAPVPFRELAGALVIDRRGAPANDDRVLVITEWSNLTAAQLGSVMRADDSGKAFAALKPRLTFVINGLSWPATERLSYRLGETARWRVINLSSQAHPMHLHGFYFEVESLGNGLTDRYIAAADRHPVVTQVLPPASTMTMAWTPERAGNWLFHCHLMHHVSLERRLSAPSGDAHDHAAHDPSSGMAGMILGVTVTGAGGVPAAEKPALAPRRLTLTMRRQGANEDASIGISVEGDRVPAASRQMSSPGPRLVLKRGEPVEITVSNQLGEPTALHWHGMELESYYDGVHNWSGMNRTLAPMIEAGGSFVVRFTPPRTGTFIYHTHLHDYRQLPLGLYGPLLVVDDDQAHQAELDHVVIVGRSGIDPAAPDVIIPATPLVINGETSPVLAWKAGAIQRVRLINITPDSIVSVSLQSSAPLLWTLVAKDGAPLPSGARTPAPARQTIAPGETYDFEVDVPAGRRTLWLEVRTPAGKWEAQAHVIAK